MNEANKTCDNCTNNNEYHSCWVMRHTEHLEPICDLYRPNYQTLEAQNKQWAETAQKYKRAMEKLANLYGHCPPPKSYAKIGECHLIKNRNCFECRCEWALEQDENKQEASKRKETYGDY